MFRRALVLHWLVAAVCVAGVPSVMADGGPEDRVEDLLPVVVEASLGEDGDVDVQASGNAGGLVVDYGFWTRAAEPSVEATVEGADLEVSTAGLELPPVEELPARELVDGWLWSPVARAAFTLPDATEPAAEVQAPAAEPEPEESQVAAASAAATPVKVPTEALVLTAAAAASVGWALGVPAAIAEKLKQLLGLAGGVAGYTRLAKEDVLGHDVREELYTRVRDEPGLSVAELADASDAGRNTVVYHLRVLEREGLVRSERQGRRRVYYCTSGGRAAREEALEHAVLGHETTRTIHERVAARPGLDQQELCSAVGVRPSLAHWHVKRLLDAGLLRKERDGRRVRYYPQA